MITERIVLPEFGAHWYDREGNPHYEVEMKTKPGQMRKATIADARANGWLPSVTGILQMVYRYNLEAWIQDKYIEAGATTPRLEGEDMTDFKRRIRDEGRAEAIAAAEFGTRLHAAIAQEIALEGASAVLSGQEDLWPYLDAFHLWAAEQALVVSEAERCFADVDERYGGKLDCLGTLAGKPVIIDWKSSRTMNLYPEMALQLAAYAHGIGEPTTDIVTVLIHSQQPGVIEVHNWGDSAPYFKEFQLVKQLYYSSVGPWNSAVK